MPSRPKRKEKDIGLGVLGGLLGVIGRPLNPAPVWECTIADEVVRLSGGRETTDALIGSLREGTERAAELPNPNLNRDPDPNFNPNGEGTERAAELFEALKLLLGHGGLFGDTVDSDALVHVATLYQAARRETDAMALLERALKMKVHKAGLKSPDAMAIRRNLKKI